jgi:CBS domain-containing protein
MGLLKIATVPPVLVDPETAVIRAVERMHEADVGAVAVVEEGKLVGVFTERDLMNRVVLRRRDPETTPVSEVMTRDVISVRRDMPFGDAFRMMVGRNFRHLPIVVDDGRVIGMLSARHLYEHAVERLQDELNSVVSYFSADGPGGD